MTQPSGSLQSQWQDLVKDWMDAGAFDQALFGAFGSKATKENAERLRSTLASSDGDAFPRVVELSPEYLDNHFAAFSAETNTIYVDPDLTAFPGLALSAYAHELGHWVDYELHGEFTDHSVVRNFADLLVGRTYRAQDEHDHDSESTGALTLPGGETVSAQFFDTPTHVRWIQEQLPFLSARAVQVIEGAQNDTDYFSGSSYASIKKLKYSPYGLQTHAPSHFDNNNISGGLSAVRSRWNDGITRFNSTLVPEITSEQFLGVNKIDALSNPLFVGADAGIQLLLYRFGQINHALEDFYSHSNWVESVNRGLIGSTQLLEGGLDLPIVLQPGEFVPGTNVMIAQSGPQWSSMLKKSGTGTYSLASYDVYWNVDSRDPAKGGGILSATTLDGNTVYGLATGATNGAIYKDRDFSVFLRDPGKTGVLEREYFRGFDHGGIAGTVYGQWVGPLNKDKTDNPNFLAAKKLANLQLQNEWDRMGSLIYKNYGVEGLRRFAAFALSTQESRDAYVATFSNPGARYFQGPSALSMASAFAASAYNEEMVSASDVDNLPDIRLVRLFGDEFFNTSSPFDGYQYRYQFFDVTTGSWLDTDFNDISIHHELEPDEIESITTPSPIQRWARGERAVWSLSREDSLDESATNYFVERVNLDVGVYIDNFDVTHDRVVLVDAAGREEHLPEELYGASSVEKLVAELAKYGIQLNFRPEIEFDPGVVLIRDSQLASPVVIEAASVAGDVLNDQLFFVGYDGSIPFLELVDGALRASSINSDYLGHTYTAYVDISDGVSVVRAVPVRIAVAPKLVIEGQSFDSESSFRVKINELTGQGFDIVAQISDQLPNTLDQFLPIATSIGSASGTPTGYDSSELIVDLGDDLQSGSVKFWLRDASGALKPLTVSVDAGGGFDLALNGVKVARISHLSGGLSVPEISPVAYPDVMDDGLGLRLNQSFADVASRDAMDPWTISLSMDLFREAAYSSEVGLFLFDRLSAQIIDPLTGLSSAVSGSDWAQDAERFAVWTGTTANMTPKSFATSFQVDGRIDLDSVALMPFMKTPIDGQVFYFSTFDGLNVDGGRHVAELSRNVFGFEDTPGLGDHDFDDVILRVNSMSVS